MLRFSKAFWYISIVLFLVSLFYFYAGMTERMAYSGNLGMLDQFDSHQLFYISLGVFVFTNVLCFSLARLLQFKYSESPMTEVWVAGLFGFSAVVNFFFISSLITILVIQNEIPDFYYLAFAGPFFLLVWLVIFSVHLLKSRTNLKKTS